MAKTIKEMAEDYALHCEADDDAAYRGFEAGANAVLDEIIACFPDTPFCNPNEVIDIIASRIKELKG